MFGDDENAPVGEALVPAERAHLAGSATAQAPCRQQPTGRVPRPRRIAWNSWLVMTRVRALIHAPVDGVRPAVGPAPRPRQARSSLWWGSRGPGPNAGRRRRAGTHQTSMLSLGEWAPSRDRLPCPRQRTGTRQHSAVGGSFFPFRLARFGCSAGRRVHVGNRASGTGPGAMAFAWGWGHGGSFRAWFPADWGGARSCIHFQPSGPKADRWRQGRCLRSGGGEEWDRLGRR